MRVSLPADRGTFLCPRIGFDAVHRTPLKRYTPLRSKTKLRVKGHSEVSEIKDEIQSVLRQIVILRDRGCILRTVAGTFVGDVLVPACGGYAKSGLLILQADHLITRSNSATYADARLVVCVCKAHHGWKSIAGNLRKRQYDAVVRALLPSEIVELWDRCEAESWRPTRTTLYDWKLLLAVLKQERDKIGA